MPPRGGVLSCPVWNDGQKPDVARLLRREIHFIKGHPGFPGERQKPAIGFRIKCIGRAKTHSGQNLAKPCLDNLDGAGRLGPRPRQVVLHGFVGISLTPEVSLDANTRQPFLSLLITLKPGNASG